MTLGLTYFPYGKWWVNPDFCWFFVHRLIFYCRGIFTLIIYVFVILRNKLIICRFQTLACEIFIGCFIYYVNLNTSGKRIQCLCWWLHRNLGCGQTFLIGFVPKHHLNLRIIIHSLTDFRRQSCSKQCCLFKWSFQTCMQTTHSVFKSTVICLLWNIPIFI